MGPLNLDGLPPNALLLVDSAPIVTTLERRDGLAERFHPVFEAYDAGRMRLAVTTVTMAEVLVGVLRDRDEALAKRYRAHLDEFRVVPLDADIDRVPRRGAAHRASSSTGLTAAAPTASRSLAVSQQF